MKLLFICEYFPQTTKVDVHGGIEVRTFEIARRLSRRHKVTVIASRESGKPKLQSLSGIQIVRVGSIRSYTTFGQYRQRLLFSIAAIKRGLTTDFDLVEGVGLMGWLPAFTVGFIKHKKRTAVVADIVQAYTQEVSPFLRKLLVLWEKVILKRRWDGIICISHTIAGKLIELGVAKNIKTIYCGVNSKQIRRLPADKRPFSICCVARLVSYKRVEDLIRATAVIRNKFPHVTLHIIGIGDDEKKLKDLTAELNLEKSVRFYGFIKDQKEVWQIMKNSTLFCVPSVVEGFGLVTVEAMATGKPVVLADVPINHEVTQNKGALFFRPQDPEDLTEKIIILLSQKLIYQKLSRQAREVATRYDWRQVTEQLEKFYADLCTD